MGTINFPSVNSNMDVKQLADLVARVMKEVEFLANGNISSQNVRELAGYLVSLTEFMHKSRLVGLSGFDPKNPLAIRFWAGDIDKEIAPFRVNQSGQLFATDAFITGLITGSTIIGGIIKTSDTGARIEISSNSLKTYNSSEQLQGPAWGETTPSANYGDMSFYDSGVETMRIENQLAGGGWLIKSMNSGVLRLGGTGRSTFASGTWTFSNPINGDLNGNADTATYADHAGTASSADELSPSGEVSWFQVDKTGSDLADLSTKNLSSLTQNSLFRTVTDVEKSTWNGKLKGVGTFDYGSATTDNLSSAYTWKDVTFNQTFSNKPVVIVSIESDDSHIVYPELVSNTGFRAVAKKIDGTTTTVGKVINWHAVGT